MVEYDEQEKVIHSLERLEELRMHLAGGSGGHQSRDIPVAGLGLVFTSVVLLGWTGVVPFDRLSGHALALAASLSMVGIGVTHQYLATQRRTLESPPPEAEPVEDAVER